MPKQRSIARYKISASERHLAAVKSWKTRRKKATDQAVKGPPGYVIPEGAERRDYVLKHDLLASQRKAKRKKLTKKQKEWVERYLRESGLKRTRKKPATISKLANQYDAGYKPKIRKSAPKNEFYRRRWKVQSQSDPNRYYIVAQTQTGEFQCNCPRWRYVREQCKHIAAVKAGLH